MYKLFTVLLACASLTAHSQDYIYKPNAQGQVEVYKASYGIPQGTAIARISRNSSGYVEIRSLNSDPYFQKNQDPYSNRISYQAVRSFMAPVASIMNTLNAYRELLNRQERVRSQQDADATLNNLKSLFADMQTSIDNLVSFYNSVRDKPAYVTDGWHNVVEVGRINLTAAGLGDKTIQFGWAYVESNSVKEVITREFTGGIEFSNLPMDPAPIIDCKASKKSTEVYFIDYILDRNSHAPEPTIGKQYFDIADNINGLIVEVYKNDPKIFGQGGANLVGWIPIMRDMNGDVVITNYFSSYPGQYFYQAKDAYNRVWVGSFTIDSRTTRRINLTLR
jgi:hypothetical protein